MVVLGVKVFVRFDFLRGIIYAFGIYWVLELIIIFWEGLLYIVWGRFFCLDFFKDELRIIVFILGKKNCMSLLYS